jgi:hypothetical protein
VEKPIFASTCGAAMDKGVVAVHVGGGRPVEKAARRAGPVATTVTSDRHVHAVALKSFAGWASGRCKLAGTIEVGRVLLKGFYNYSNIPKGFKSSNFQNTNQFLTDAQKFPNLAWW